MHGTVRRLALASVVVAGAVVVVPAPASAAACTGPRLVGITGGRVVEGTVRGGLTRLDLTVTTSGCPQRASVRYEAVGYTARKDDFVAVAGELAYPAGGVADLTITVPVVADAVAEPTECFSVRLTAVAGSVRADPAEAAVLILDDDRGSGGTGGFICSE